MTNNNLWGKIALNFDSDMREALQIQHNAAQYIALTGRHLLPQQDDDSNTNMQYISGYNILAGKILSNDLRVALHLSDMFICMIDNGNSCKYIIAIEGKTQQQVFDELKNALARTGIDVTKLKNKMHYEMPYHALNRGAAFSLADKDFFIENALSRHNADIIVKEIAGGFTKSEPVGIWPHHFDTGSFFPLKSDNKGSVSKSISIGWAIPDNMVDEPYFYLSWWAEHESINMSELPSPDAGEWITSGWNGGILKHSDIVNTEISEKQYDKVMSFFTSGIEILTQIVK